jgi:peptidyl-prolyl cis-trans isomerase B (cyclophilin B)
MPRARTTRIPALLGALALVLVLGGCSVSSDKGSSAAAGPDSLPLHTSTYVVKGDERVQVVTDRGTFTIALLPKLAPNTVATFLELVSSKFYDGVTFHRVEPGFVVQAGDPSTKDPKADPATYGSGGPGFRIKAEFNGSKHETGTVAMARAQDPDSGGSQFYITLAPQPSLDNQYTVFGKVVSGMDVVDALEKGDIIRSMTIVPAR